MIHTYGYGLEEGAKKLEALNYYTNEMITIPLDSQLDAKGNAQKYFDRYNKLKRTYEALTKLTEETKTGAISAFRSITSYPLLSSMTFAR